MQRQRDRRSDGGEIRAGRADLRQGRAVRRGRDPRARAAADAVRARRGRRRCRWSCSSTPPKAAPAPPRVAGDGGGREVPQARVRSRASLHHPPLVQGDAGATTSPARASARATRPRQTFTAVVLSVSRRFTLFNPDGKPLRATVSVALKQFATVAEQVDGDQLPVRRPYPPARGRRRARRCR